MKLECKVLILVAYAPRKDGLSKDLEQDRPKFST